MSILHTASGWLQRHNVDKTASVNFVLLLWLLQLAWLPSVAVSATIDPGSDSQSVQSGIDREIRITNGSRTSVGQFPFLTAVLSGRQATLNFDDDTAAARFFSGGMVSRFSGQLVDCGFATSICVDVTDKVCSIILDFPVDDAVPLTPSMQLQNCRRGGGVAAVFRPNTRDFIDRLDMYDGNPSIPAVYVYDEESYQHLLLALAQGTGGVSADNVIPGKAICGGTYLGGSWVLTAAHCVMRKLNDGSTRVVGASELLVNVGAYNLESESVFVQAVEEIIVSDYRLVRGWDENDYALLRLDSEPQRGEPVNLISQENLDTRIASAEPAVVLGWGSALVREPLLVPSLSDSTSAVPLAATLRLLPVASCRLQWRDFLLLSGAQYQVPDLREIHLCASSDIQQDTCQGDSGGPLLLEVDGELQLAGITSFGLGCGGSLALPGVYASVSGFRQWVADTTGLSRGQQGIRVSSMLDFTTPASSDGGGGAAGVPGTLTLFVLLFIRALFSFNWRQPLKPLRVLTICLGVTFCVSIAACGAGQPVDGPASALSDLAAPIEKIDAVYSDGVISAKVISSGCTSDEHFAVRYEVDEQVCQITVYRTQPDLCKRAVQAQSVSIDWEIPQTCESVSIVNPRLSED